MLQFDSAELRALLPELVLAGATFALLLFDLFFDSKQKGITHWLSMLVLIGVGIMALMGAGGYNDDQVLMNGMFIRDALGNFSKGVICLVAAVGFIYTLPYLKARGIYKGEVPVLMLFAVLGMMVLASAANLIMVYVGLEMLALSSYALVAIDRDNPRATEAAMKYFVLGSLASGLMLYGMSLVYGGLGTLDLPNIYSDMVNPAWVNIGMVFILAGAAFKLGAAPFHMWISDVYQGAPTPVTMFIGAAPKVAAFVMVFRLFVGEDNYLGWNETFRTLIAGVAALSLIIGNLMALWQGNLKRMLAYSTVSHIGFLLMGLAGGSEGAYEASLFYAVVYAVTTLAAFGFITLMSKQGFEAEEIADYRGLGKRNPWQAFLILLVVASLAGLPPFIGFFAKVAVIEAALSGGLLWLAITGVICAVIGMFYYLRLIKAMYFEQPEDGASVANVEGGQGMRLVFALNALLLLFLAPALGTVMNWCNNALTVVLG